MNSILIVDDNVHLIAVLGKMLAPIAQVRFATAGLPALAQMRAEPPQLVLLDAEMPGMSGYAVCQAMRADPELDKIPVIFVTAHNDAQAEVRALDAGAVDFITKPVNEPVLLARVQTQLRLKALTDELRRSAAIDGLTRVANRGAFDERLQLEHARAARTGGELSLLLLDVDHFKRFNDHYGHPGGDACLREIASALAGQARRPADLASRIGGEEFALLLPDTDMAGALGAAERLIAAIASLALPHAASPTAARVTVSIGIASCVPPQQQAAGAERQLVERADQALYRAKAEGRNRACAALFS
ncbi:diguanylate cyclase [Roseateles sp. DC23W]|uniref:diguanylate cyclase n=1 Tax=Pelomonas dachongensis TaxID=3299029 RepID=A0ABW7ET87_9BURK